MSGRGLTVIEKILSRHAGEEVRPGRIVWIDLDLVSARDFAGPNVVQNYRRHYGQTPVADPSRTFFTFDLTVPAKTIQYANNQQICRDFAREQGIAVHDVDAGIGTHVMMENGLVRPGQIAVGTDSHLNVLGAVGVFGQGMGDVDIAFAFRHRRTWFEVPHTVKVVVKGEPSETVEAKDLALAILREVQTTHLLGHAVEFTGPAVERLTLSGRITLLSMVTEMSGIAGFIPFTDATREEYLAWVGGDASWLADLEPDGNAEYLKELVVDVQDLKPLVAMPPAPHHVQEVASLTRPVPVDFCFLGSCTNGQVDDLRAAARILKGRKLAEGVRMAVVPATRRVYARAMSEGILQDLFEAGAIISNPGCGGCAQGHIGMTGKGEVMLSTGNRNFPGKQGDGANYLVTVWTLALSALCGELCDQEVSR